MKGWLFIAGCFLLGAGGSIVIRATAYDRGFHVGVNTAICAMSLSLRPGADDDSCEKLSPRQRAYAAEVSVEIRARNDGPTA